MRKTTLNCLLALSVGINASHSMGYELLGEFWQDSEATMLVNINGFSPSNTSWNQAFDQAAGSWNDVVSSFNFDIRSQFSDPCAGYIPEIPENGNTSGAGFYENACGDDFGSDTLAITLSLTDGGQFFTETDIVFNENVTWDIYSGPARFATDFRRVTVHELGHVMGLDHEPDNLAIMAPFIGNLEQPTPDDIAGANALYPDSSLENILLNLEEPASSPAASGVSNIRGWALASTGIEQIEVLVDGTKLADIPYGGTRADVGNAFPDYPNADNSGFSMAWAWSLLEEGDHTITVRAHDTLGRTEQVSRQFSVTRFDSSFIANANELVLQGSATILAPHTVVLNQVSAEGKNYSVTLQWNTASQKFEISDIIPQ